MLPGRWKPRRSTFANPWYLAWGPRLWGGTGEFSHSANHHGKLVLGAETGARVATFAWESLQARDPMYLAIAALSPPPFHGTGNASRNFGNGPGVGTRKGRFWNIHPRQSKVPRVLPGPRRICSRQLASDCYYHMYSVHFAESHMSQSPEHGFEFLTPPGNGPQLRNTEHTRTYIRTP